MTAAGQLLGLAVSIVAYVAGAMLMVRVSAWSLRLVPPEWLEHPVLRPRYQAARGHRSVRPPAEAWVWLVGFAVAFGAIAVVDYAVGYEVAYVAALAVFFTAMGVAEQRERTRDLARREGLALPAYPRWVPVLWTPRLVMTLGFFGTACFLGGLAALPLQ